MTKSICLNMIVSEADSFYLQQSLPAIAPYIDHWVIANRNCNENTLTKIEALLSNVNGEIVDIEGTIKADIRNTLINYSKQYADYILTLDPWEILVNENETVFDLSSDHDGYYIYSKGQIEHANLHLIKASINWHYMGFQSEFILSDTANNFSYFDELHLQNITFPAHAKILAEDATKSLKVHLADNPDDSHANFVIAKNYLYKQEHLLALQHFDQYLSAEQHWDNEWKWYAYYYRAKLLEKLEKPNNEIIDTYLKAYSYRPQRVESLVDLARFYRIQGNTALAYLYSKQAYSSGKPERETYDLNTHTYQWQIATEFAQNAQNLGHHDESVRAANFAFLNTRVSHNLRDSLIHSRQKSIDALQQEKHTQAKKQRNKIRLVIPYRNAGAALQRCVQSVITQTYDNFIATFVDDCSTDNSSACIPSDDPRFELIKNSERQGALRNRMNIILSSDAKDILLWLDGDDQLSHDQALERLNEIYNTTNCWLTYGQYLSQRGNLGHGVPYTSQQHLITELESGEMRFPMHPITHRAGLFQRIAEFDPDYSCFKDEQGDWLEYASDAVLARPLFYLAGYERIYFCSQALYLYNEGHENSEFLANKKQQIEACRQITQKLRCPRVDSYLPFNPESGDSNESSEPESKSY